MRYPSWLSTDPWSASQLKDRVCLHSLQIFFSFFLEMVICGISSGAHFPTDKGSVCFDVGWCWSGPSQVVMDWQCPCLCLGLQIQSSWRRRPSGGEPRQMQMSFLHVCSAFVSWIDCGLTLGGWQNPLCVLPQNLCVSGHLSKTGRSHWSWGDKW